MLLLQQEDHKKTNDKSRANTVAMQRGDPKKVEGEEVEEEEVVGDGEEVKEEAEEEVGEEVEEEVEEVV